MDKKYWDGYYTDHHAKSEPTSFAKSIINTLPKKTCKLLEIGCGNGRDSFYFSGKGHDVSAFDQSEVIINTLQNSGKNSPNFFIDLEALVHRKTEDGHSAETDLLFLAYIWYIKLKKLKFQI